MGILSYGLCCWRKKKSVRAFSRLCKGPMILSALSKITCHKQGYFIFCLKDHEEIDMVLNSDHFMGRKPVVKSWSPNFDYEAEIMRLIPRLPNLPRACWSDDSLNMIASTKGVPLCTC